MLFLCSTTITFFIPPAWLFIVDRTQGPNKKLLCSMWQSWGRDQKLTYWEMRKEIGLVWVIIYEGYEKLELQLSLLRKRKLAVQEIVGWCTSFKIWKDHSRGWTMYNNLCSAIWIGGTMRFFGGGWKLVVFMRFFCILKRKTFQLFKMFQSIGDVWERFSGPREHFVR